MAPSVCVLVVVLVVVVVVVAGVPVASTPSGSVVLWYHLVANLTQDVTSYLGPRLAALPAGGTVTATQIADALAGIEFVTTAK